MHGMSQHQLMKFTGIETYLLSEQLHICGHCSGQCCSFGHALMLPSKSLKTGPGRRSRAAGWSSQPAAAVVRGVSPSTDCQPLTCSTSPPSLPAGIAPVQAFDDVFSFEPNSVLVGPPGVLLNDKIDPSCPRDQVKVHVLDEPEFGTLTLNPDGGFSYRSEVQPNKADTFTYSEWHMAAGNTQMSRRPQHTETRRKLPDVHRSGVQPAQCAVVSAANG